MYAIQMGNTLLAIQTSKELVVSSESGLLFKALCLVWFLTDPDNCREREQYESYSMGDPMKFLFSLFVTRSPELPIPNTYIPVKPPSTSKNIYNASPWTTYPKEWTSEQADRLWSAVRFALSKRHHSHATYLVRPLLLQNRLSVVSLLKAFNVDAAFTDILATTTYMPLAERILAHAFAAADASSVDPVKSLDTSQWEVLWTQSTGRCFSVSPEAMALWGVRSKSSTCLLGCPLLVTESTTSTFWKDQVKRHGCTVNGDRLVFPNDDACESFYDNFPIDIPDEWSLSERAKSHGIVMPVSVIPNPWAISFLQLWA